MADGFEALQTQINRLRGLDSFVPDVAHEVAAVVRTEAKVQAAKGLGPDGKPFKPTKKGERPLKRAADQIKVSVVQTVILVKLSGHYARHHLGAVRGKVKREIIPTRKIPDTMTRAIKTVVERKFNEAMR